MAKKIVALLLAGLMCAGCMAGCSSSTEETTASSGAATTAAASAAPSETSEYEENLDAVDTLIANTTGTVTLSVWASEEDQEFTQGLIDNFIAQYPDVTFDIQNNKMEIHNVTAEPWKVTLVETGLNTMTGGRLKRVQKYIRNEKC